MGWLYMYGQTKKGLIEERCKPWTREDGKAGGRTLKKCIRGNVLWTVREMWRLDENGAEVKEKWIGCDLMQASEGDWGYKDMEESMGPCYYSCPIEYLDEVPMPSGEYSQKWRDSVRSYHERRRKRFVRAGDKAILVHTAIERLNGMTVTIEGRRRSKLMARAADGTLLLVPTQCVERVAA